jgi:hypothetical protein
MNTNSSSGAMVVPKWLVAILNLAALCVVIYGVRLILSRPLRFDDAFMFERYAIHLRQGFGVSWNPDGVHTGGMTSLGWFVAILPLVFMPFRHGQPLALESFSFGIAGMALIAWGASKLASTPLLRRFWLVFPALVVVLVNVHFFLPNMVNGMDTMLSFAVDAALSCAIWGWCRGNRLAMVVAVLGVCAVCVRPENGLLAVVGPLLAVVLVPGRERRGEAVRWGVTFAGLLALYGIAYRVYFHAWFPLGFYMKAGHAYLGYVGAQRFPPDVYMRDFLLLAVPILAFPMVCLSKRSARIAAVYLVPVLITFAYLTTVTQIMGSFSRYYVPFLAPVIVAALWMTDVALQEEWKRTVGQRWRMMAVGAVLVAGLAAVSWRPLHRWSQRRQYVAPYAAPKLVFPAGTDLPEQVWFSTASLIANDVVKPLPAGTVIATSEVGIIGVSAPQVNVIDLAGLNDNDIALHGFDMDRLLDRKPAFIWFPHFDYTWQRRAMFCSARLLQEYTVIGGNSFIYSVAIRRDAPETPQLTTSVTKAFAQLYPGVEMKDYMVSAVNCN